MMGIRRLLSLPFHFDLKKWEKIFRPRGIAPADLLLGAFCLLLFRIQRNPRFEIGTAGGGRPWSLQLDLDGTLSAEEGILRVAGANASAKGSGAETGQRKFMTVFGPAGEREALGSILSTGGLAFLWEMGEGDAGSVTFHYDCYEEDHEEAFLRIRQLQLETLLADLCAHPEKPVDALEIVSGTERAIIAKSNDTDADFSRDKCVHQLLEEMAVRQPEATALDWPEGEMTYGAFNRKANRLAAHLSARGAGPGTFLAIAADRSPELILAMFAAMKTGAAYVPLTLRLPPERLGYILLNCGATLLLTTAADRVSVPETVGIVDLCGPESYASGEENPVCPVSPRAPVALVYTSGTTGNPKGVLIRHDTIVNYCEFNQREFQIDRTDHIMQFAPFPFSTSILEIVTTLICGAKLCLVTDAMVQDPAAFYRRMMEVGATILLAPPEYIFFLPLSPTLRIVETGASECRREISGKIVQSARHVNAYGLTEGSVPTVWHGREGEPPRRIPIGRPVANTRVHIMDGDRECGLYMPGELCITGMAVSDGYLGLPQLTAQKFVKNPQGAGVMLRTGDIAQWNKDGDIEYFGRVDNQVQIRGMRVELEEVEYALINHPALQNASAICRPAVNGEDQIVAFVVSAEPLDTEQVRRDLYERLPEYMVPSVVRQLDAFPLTANGKVDKNALAAIPLQSGDAGAPRDRAEDLVAQVFREILGLEEVSVFDSFFALGGHSLRAARASHLLESLSGVNLPLRQWFDTPTVEGMAGALRDVLKNGRPQGTLTESTAGTVEDPAPPDPIPRAAPQGSYPMSSAQKRLFLVCQVADTRTAYNISAALLLDGEADVERIRYGLDVLAARHEAFRTGFLMENGVPVQKIVDEVSIPLEIIRISQADGDQLVREYETTGKTGQRYSRWFEDFVRPFRLDSPPLARVRALIGGGRTLLIIDTHHLISDGTTMQRIQSDFSSAYSGRMLPDLPCQYKDYSQWSLARELTGQAAWWRAEFEGEIPVLDLHTDFPRPKRHHFDGKTMLHRIEPAFRGRIERLAWEQGATPYMIFLAALMILLGKYARQEDVVVGSPISGRTHRDCEQMVGLFIGTLALRGKPVREKTFSQFLAEIRRTCLKAYENQDYPFEELVDVVQVNRDLSRNPLFDVMLAMQNNELARDELAGLTLLDVETGPDLAMIDLTFLIDEEREGEGFLMKMVFSTALFTEETARGMMDHYLHLIHQAMDAPDSLIGDLSPLDDEERKRVLHRFNDTKTPLPEQGTYVHIFEGFAKERPEHVAMEYEGQRMRYGLMNRRCNQLARMLRKRGTETEDLVALYIGPGFGYGIGKMGIMKAGGAFLPIDPSTPEARLRFILEDSGAKAVVEAGACLPFPVQIPVVNLEAAGLLEADDLSPLLPEAAETANLNLPLGPENLAYCIYTSGTTGQPKGVLVEHRGIVNQSLFYEKIGIHADDITLLMASCSFDASVWEMSMAFLRGGTLRCLPEGATRDPVLLRPRLSGCTVATATPHLAAAARIEGMRLFISGGSAPSPELVEAANDEYINAYGPTEITICATAWIHERGTPVPFRIPIGKPLPNYCVYILDGDNLCGINMPGELCIGGPGVSRGYLNRPELTRQKFIENPFGAGRLYRSGDLARWLPDGNLEFLGRTDDQVKIRGYRVELGEIESVLQRVGAAEDVAVVVRKDPSGEPAIFAYIMCEQEPAMDRLPEQMGKELPAYMLPVRIHWMKAFPRTATGKVDKKALPAIDLREKDYIEPRDQEERWIAEVFEAVTGVQKVGVKDNFFALGGHSLRAARGAHLLEERSGFRLPLRNWFETPTAEGLAASLRTLMAGEASGADRLVGAGAEAHDLWADPAMRAPIPFADRQATWPASPPQKRLYIISQMDDMGVVYNIPAAFVLSGEADESGVRAALNQLARRHESLRTGFHMEGDDPVQRIEEEVIIPLETGQIRGDGLERDEIMALLTEFVRPFALDQPPLMRAKMLTGNGKTLFLFDLHHIISDGATMEILLSEFAALCGGQTLPPVTHQYRDYSQWFFSRDLSAQKKYWVDLYEEERPPMDLPTDFPRPARQSFAGAQTFGRIDGRMRRRMDQLATATGSTPYMILLATLMIWLGRYSGQEDVVVGSPISGRVHRDSDRIAGMFVGTLPLRGFPAKEKPFDRLLWEVRNSCLLAYENQEYPFEDLIENIHVPRDMTRNPLFDVLLAMQNNERSAEVRSGMGMLEAFSGPATAKLDLTFNITDEEDGYGIELIYATALYRRDSAERMLDHYIHLIENAVLDPRQPVGMLPMISGAERHLVLEEFPVGDTPGPMRTFVQRFESLAASDENRIALHFEGETMTYGALNRSANRLARRLLSLGLAPEEMVAVYGKRGFGIVIGALAVMKAGGAFLPLEPSIPANRLRFLLEDSRAFAVIHADVRLPFPVEVPILDALDVPGVQDIEGDLSAAPADDNLNLKASSDPCGLAYCIYTSGTTGQPKGVLVEHRGLSRLSDFFAGSLGLTRDDTILQFVSCAFDGYIWELTQALTLGAALRLIPEQTAKEPRLLREALAGCTTAALPPQIAAIVKPEGLKLLVTAGSQATPDMVRQAASVNEAYVNGYGPTETTVNATWWAWEKGGEIPDNIPIGRPIPGALCYILDGMAPCGIGVPGEICIGGDGVARGYLNQPELTEEKFIPNPFLHGKRGALPSHAGAGTHPDPTLDPSASLSLSARLYRTGDLGRWRPDGTIEFLGRVDEQIKIRGSRVEPAEVESVLKRCTGVRDAAVVVRKNERDEPLIYGYVTGDAPLDLNRLRGELDAELPDYMIPGRLAQLDTIPYNISGKLDQKTLPDIAPDLDAYLPPAGREEMLVARFFREILGSDRVGARTNFYSLGGDSIKAIRMVSRLREAGYDISVKQIMEQRTVQRIAAILENAGKDQKDWGPATGIIPLTPIQKNFFQANYPKPGYFNQSIALMAKDPVSEDVLRRALTAVTLHHDMLRAVYPDGIQTVPPPDAWPHFHLQLRDLRGKPIHTEEIEGDNVRFQAEASLTAGPLLRVALLRTDAGDHLIFCAHHLIMDGYSWRILLEDLVNAYRQIAEGQEVVLPAKTAPFRAWSEALRDYGALEDLRSEIPLWEKMLAEAAGCDIPREAEIPPEKRGTGSEEIRVDSGCVSSLLYEAGRAYQTEIADLLLSALAMAVGRWTGMEKVVVELESHGREELHVPINVDRTVGWFTCTCPVLLPCKATAAEAIPAVRAALRRIPNHGIGFGLLMDRIGSPEKADWHPRLCFNYLGQLDDMEMSSTMIPSPLPCGRDVDRENIMPNEINISGAITGGELIMSVDYDRTGWRPESMDSFRAAYETALAEIVSHCLTKEMAGADLGLTDDEVEALNALIEDDENHPS